jgi:hypothetical protein
MMINKLVPGMIAALVSTSALASPCGVATLLSYEQSGSCTIGDKEFSNFFYATSAGSGLPDASGVTVTPVDVATNHPGLQFTASWLNLTSLIQDIGFGFHVAEASGGLVGAELSVFGMGFNDDETVNTTKEVFDLVATDGSPNSSVNFGLPTDLVKVSDDLEVFSSGSHVIKVTKEFDQNNIPPGPPLVPEPPSLLLLAASLICFYITKATCNRFGRV